MVVSHEVAAAVEQLLWLIGGLLLLAVVQTGLCLWLALDALRTWAEDKRDRNTRQ